MAQHTSQTSGPRRRSPGVEFTQPHGGKVVSRPALILVVAVLAALDVLIRINLFGWLGLFAGASPLSALESAFWVLLLTAAIFASPVLERGRSLIVAGTILIAAAEVTRLGLLIWESGILDLSTPADIESFQRVGVFAATAAELGSFMGVGALAWGLWRGSNRPAAPLTAVRLALIAGAAIAGAIDVGLLIAEWSPLAFEPWVQSAGWIYFALPALTSLVWVLAAVVTIRAARSGPPLDWRWPVGIGVTIHLVAEAVLSLASLASTGTSAAAVAPWFIWIRLASACGIGLVIAGLAGAAFIRYPGVVVSDS